MSFILDSIWHAYESASDTLRIVRACVVGQAVDTSRLFAGTKFVGLPDADALALVDAAQDQLANQAVLSLYAAFEVALRDHLVSQSQHLRANATHPDADFADKLAKLYEGKCNDVRMDAVEKLFRSAVGDNLLAQAGHIRTYRHWVAHGQRWKQPPPTTPMFAYTALTQFLSAI